MRLKVSINRYGIKSYSINGKPISFNKYHTLTGGTNSELVKLDKAREIARAKAEEKEADLAAELAEFADLRAELEKRKARFQAEEKRREEKNRPWEERKKAIKKKKKSGPSIVMPKCETFEDLTDTRQFIIENEYLFNNYSKVICYSNKDAGWFTFVRVYRVVRVMVDTQETVQTLEWVSADGATPYSGGFSTVEDILVQKDLKLDESDLQKMKADVNEITLWCKDVLYLSPEGEEEENPNYSSLQEAFTHLNHDKNYTKYENYKQIFVMDPTSGDFYSLCNTYMGALTITSYQKQWDWQYAKKNGRRHSSSKVGFFPKSSLVLKRDIPNCCIEDSKELHKKLLLKAEKRKEYIEKQRLENSRQSQSLVQF